MSEVYWAGIGYDPDQADILWDSWWHGADKEIDRIIAKKRPLKPGTPKQIPVDESAAYYHRRYFLHDYTHAIVDVFQVDNTPFRIGFGLLAYTEQEARGLLEDAKKFLSDLHITHPWQAVSAWCCVGSRASTLRRIP